MILKGINFKRGRKTDPFYLSLAWRSYRKQFLMMNPYCVVCGQEAKVVDHILPFQQGGSIWDATNHQALCRSCSGKKSNSDKEYYGKQRWCG